MLENKNIANHQQAISLYPIPAMIALPKQDSKKNTLWHNNNNNKWNCKSLLANPKPLQLQLPPASAAVAIAATKSKTQTNSTKHHNKDNNYNNTIVITNHKIDSHIACCWCCCQ